MPMVRPTIYERSNIFFCRMGSFPCVCYLLQVFIYVVYHHCKLGFKQHLKQLLIKSSYENNRDCFTYCIQFCYSLCLFPYKVKGDWQRFGRGGECSTKHTTAHLSALQCHLLQSISPTQTWIHSYRSVCILTAMKYFHT